MHRIFTPRLALTLLVVLRVLLLAGCAPVDPGPGGGPELPDEPSAPRTFEERLDEAAETDGWVARSQAGEVEAIATRIRVPDGINPDPVAQTDWFLGQYGAELDIDDPLADVDVSRVDEGASGTPDEGESLVVYTRTRDGVPVFGTQVRVEVNADDEITAVTADYATGLGDVDTTPAITAAEAEAIALAGLEGVELEDSTLMILDASMFMPGGETCRLVYRVRTVQTGIPSALTRFVDAHEGSLMALELEGVHEARDRRVYDAEQGSHLLLNRFFSEQVYEEAGPLEGQTPDDDERDAYGVAGTVWDYLDLEFGRESHDGNGSPVRAFVHMDTGSPNAFYHWGSMYFGEDMVTLDIFAHEYTHGIVDASAELEYQWESGAMNESMADVFAWFIDHDDTTIGEGSALGAIRSLENPGRYGYPRNVYEQEIWPEGTKPERENDRLGVHANSSIPNFAAYLATAGGRNPDSLVDIPGIGRAKAQQIYYRALTRYMSPSTDFAGAKVALRMAAWRFAQNGTHGVTYEDCGSVLTAYGSVGIGEMDLDYDCFTDDVDNCPEVYNPEQDEEDCGETAEMCSDLGAPCTGSGPSFDDQCCDDLICVVGVCQAPEPREQDSCNREENQCALGLRCRPVGDEEAPTTCCAADQQYCEEKADCCGLMDCVSNRCVGRATGEACLIGDCVGASYCSEDRVCS